MTENLSGAGEERIKQKIREQMKGCAGLLVVASGDSHNSRWMEYEGGVANEFGIPKADVRHPHRPGGPPNAHRGMQEVEWDGAKLAALVASWKEPK
jgi:hypothetical protein